MIYIYLSDFLDYIEEVCYKNTAVKRGCHIVKVTIGALSIIGLVGLVLTIGNNMERARLASTHYRYWFEQLPDNHPLKQDIYGVSIFYELPSELGIVAGALIDTQEEIIKYEFSKLDITEFGALESYINKKFDESKPEYLLLNAETTRPLKIIKLK